MALLAATQYRANRVGADGSFLLDVGEHVDTAVHVGVTWELVAGYPPQVPGLAGVEMRYHVGSHLVRAAAARWARIHPYDSLSRFDVTLWGIALVLALRAAAHALGLGAAAVRLAGFLPLAADLSFVPGLLLGAEHWAMKLGGNFLEAVFYANSISPAMAAALAALVALVARPPRRGARVARPRRRARRRHRLPEGLHRRAAAARAGPRVARPALAPARPRRGPGGRGASPSSPSARSGPRPARACGSPSLAFAPTNPARVAFGLPEASGLALALSGIAWLVLSLGLRARRRPGRVARAPPRGRAPGDARRARPDRLADRALRQHHGRPRVRRELLLPAGERPRPVALRRARVLAGVARAVATRRRHRRRRLPAAHGRARRPPRDAGAGAHPRRRPSAPWPALRAASCPGDVVLTRPGVALVPPVVVLAGRRVPLANYIPYWRQFTTPEALAAREADVWSFFRAGDAASAIDAARRLGARYVYFSGPPPGERPPSPAARPRSVRDKLLDAGALAPVHVEPRASVFRITPLAPAAGCGASRGL